MTSYLKTILGYTNVNADENADENVNTTEKIDKNDKDLSKNSEVEQIIEFGNNEVKHSKLINDLDLSYLYDKKKDKLDFKLNNSFGHLKGEDDLDLKLAFGHLKGEDDLDFKLAFGHLVKPVDFENKNKTDLVKGEEILLKKKSKKIYREPTDFDLLQTAIV